MDPEIAGLRVPVAGGGSDIGLAIACPSVADSAHVHVSDDDLSALEAIGSSDPTVGRLRG
jgi:NAD(P)-dependent dehydrogenase (short-subunit alcohol dehydrogenase family)